MSNIDYERLVWISNRYQDIYTRDEDYPTAREILIAIADWMDHEARPGSTITADTLRAIANATKTDPLDDLSPENRLGYMAMSAYCRALENRPTGNLTDDAEWLYLSPRPDWTEASRTVWNDMAAAFIAEYERQKGGDK